MCLIEIPALHSKLSRNFSWEVAPCNYPNHSFKSTGAVRYSCEGLYTYWQEMSCTQWHTDVSEMSLVEQNAFVVSWYLWLWLCRKDLIKQSKMQRKSAYANASTLFFLHLIAYCLVLLLLFGVFLCWNGILLFLHQHLDKYKYKQCIRKHLRHLKFSLT